MKKYLDKLATDQTTRRGASQWLFGFMIGYLVSGVVSLIILLVDH